MSSPLVVFVVEDEPLLRMAIVDEFVSRGFNVFEAADAQEAIVILSENPSIRILFTGIDMPGTMDGLMPAADVRDR